MSAEPTSILKTIRGAAIPLRNVSLAGVAEGCLFELTVEQRYANVEEETIEAVYTFPLPLRAVLLSFELEIGDRHLKGAVQRKREASEQYEDAISSGDSAALLEQASDGLYCMSLGSLRPGEEAMIRYRFVQPLSFEQGRLRIAIPTAVAPRYGQALEALTDLHAPEIDPAVFYPCQLSLDFRGMLCRGRVHSPTHELVMSVTPEQLSLNSRSDFAMDRDVIVLIEDLPVVTQTVLARDGQGYVALSGFPVPSNDGLCREPRTLKLLVDCSGSMGGDSIHQARDAVLAVLATLRPTDRVSLTRFGSSVEHLTDGAEWVSPATLLRLNGRVRRMAPDLGGTEMQAALEAVRSIPVSDDKPADVLMITDGEIWAIDRLLERLARADHRLFVVAVGASPVEELARQVTAVTRGACEFVTPREDMRGAVARLLARMGAPSMKLAAVQWPMAPDWVLGVGDPLFPGDTAHVLAGFGTVPAGPVRVRLECDGAQDDTAEMTWNLEGEVRCDDALPRLAAARRLCTLAQEEAADLAERYQLVSAHTSFVVVVERAEGEKADGQPEFRRVPQMLSAGWGASGTVHLMKASPCMPTPLASPLGVARADQDAHDISLAFTSAVADRQPYLSSLAAALGGTTGPSAPLPMTIAELRAQGVDEWMLQALEELVAGGLREADVVAAWLAEVAVANPQDFGGRVLRRIERAANREIRLKVAPLFAGAAHS